MVGEMSGGIIMGGGIIGSGLVGGWGACRRYPCRWGRG